MVTSGCTSVSMTVSRSLASMLTWSTAPVTISSTEMTSKLSWSSGSSSRDTSAMALTMRTIISVLAVIPSMATIAVSGSWPSMPVESSWP